MAKTDQGATPTTKPPRKSPAKATSKVTPKKKPPQPKTAAERVAAYGIDRICEALADGTTMNAIAAEIGVSFGTLSTWLAADPEHSARARGKDACRKGLGRESPG